MESPSAQEKESPGIDESLANVGGASASPQAPPYVVIHDGSSDDPQIGSPASLQSVTLSEDPVEASAADTPQEIHQPDMETSEKPDSNQFGYQLSPEDASANFDDVSLTPEQSPQRSTNSALAMPDHTNSEGVALESKAETSHAPNQLTPDPSDISFREVPPTAPSSTPTPKENGQPVNSPTNTVVSPHAPRFSDSTNRDRSTTASSTMIPAAPPAQSSHLSAVLLLSSLDSIMTSKEAKKSRELAEAAGAASALLKGEANHTPPPGPDQEAQIILRPLKLACQTRSQALMVTALDCIGKLISYGFYKVDESAHDNKASSEKQDPNDPTSVKAMPGLEMGDEVTGIICDCFVDASCPDPVQLQIIKAILALVLAPAKPGMRRLEVHQSSLLKAVRTAYNIFLLSKSPTNQAVAQGALTQIVAHVFGRVETGQEAVGRVNTGGGLSHANSPQRAITPSRGSENGAKTSSPDETRARVSESPHTSTSGSTSSNHESADPSIVSTKELPPSPTVEQNNELTEPSLNKEDNQVTLESFEKHNSFDGVSDRDGAGSVGVMSTQDYYVKDAFLVFRALCKLSMKPLGSESEKDLKSHAMRSKLLSLHLILSILNANLAIFTDPSVIIYSSTTRDQTPFVQAIKQYLCLSLSRNAISSVLSVFELSCEIFWKVVSGMRTKLKKEIEVLLNEIFLPILEMRNSTVKQKSILLTALGRLFHDPQALVEVYLNYDCDRTSLGNIYERFMNIVSKLATTQYTTSTTTSQSIELVGSPNATTNGNSSGNTSKGSNNAFGIPSIPPSLSTTSMSQGMSDSTSYSHQAVEAQLKRQSLECLVAALKSLVAWAGKGSVPTLSLNSSTRRLSTMGSVRGKSMNRPNSFYDSNSSNSINEVGNSQTGGSFSLAAEASTSQGSMEIEISDDPNRFQTAKHQKTTLIEGIKQFNFKPKRGIKFLISHGFIRSSKPKDVARFLLTADGLNKAMIGEYLGEGDPENVETMHSFIDFMDFSNMKFTEAMRTFLQAFRLPGEAQKIDRFMLKFAERYFQGNPGTLANAETAYVLAFSIIMLNTDAHSPQVKNRMTKQEFIRNNRGINQGADLPEEYLSAVYDEILADEIRMKDEVEAAVGVQHIPTGLAGSIATVGRDLQKEAYVLQSAGMANKTEILFRTLLRGQRQRNSRPADQFFEASHFEHVRPMFQVVWMPLLAGISDPLQNSDQMDMISLCLIGFKQAIKIICLFDLELERNAFVTTLAKFTFLNNLGEMKPKNVEAIKTLLDVAMVDGNYLKDSWKEVLACVSQLERFQLISQGVDIETGSEMARRTSTTKSSSRSRHKKPSEEVLGAAGASHITHAADMIFSSSQALSGTAIVDFVRALSNVSWEEIQASGLSGNPRTFCLQKLVEISYYNMGRIRLEWTQIWAILGGHFTQVCGHPNANVSFFALDSLRQLAMRFLEKEELANFQFQKDFLRPFEHTMIHSTNLDAKDMVLQCLNQMISARVENLRSGWRTMFGVFSAASKVSTERVATQAFELVQKINSEHFDRVVAYGSFADLTVCITNFCKISQFQKVSLHAIEMLKDLIPKILECPECPLSRPASEQQTGDPAVADDSMIKYWFPILFAFYDVTMHGEDLEVRKRASDYLFETLKKHGSSFPDDFWDSVCREVLFPIFAVLRSRSDVSRFSTHEEMSVWLSTTMIQALRNLIDLYTFYFSTLGRRLERLLDLLCECICQENDTLARIGTSCLQQLLEKNVLKLDDKRWEQVVDAFLNLFKTTAAHQLFDPNLRQPSAELGEGGESTPTPMPDRQAFIVPTPLPPVSDSEQDRSVVGQIPMSVTERRRVFRQIIVKCVLQLLLIETTNELLNNVEVYQTIPPASLLRLLAEIDNSYRFAKKFNADRDLRMGLWRVGFMKQLPNLLKQESSSAVTLVQVLLRLYADERPDHVAKREETLKAFVPLALDVVAAYVALDSETQNRNVAAWTPVVIEVLQGFCSFQKEAFLAHLPSLYPLLMELSSKDLVVEVRVHLHYCFYRIGVDGLGFKDLKEPSLEVPQTDGSHPTYPVVG